MSLLSTYLVALTTLTIIVTGAAAAVSYYYSTNLF